jgi:crotonobetainyl-CoA:carnitine CoA-transferase CaiB-like acyl-CoA transferase
MKVGVAVVDILTGLYAANAVLAAVHARHRSGHGYAIDLALQDCALAAQVNVAQAYLCSGVVPARQGNAHLQIVPYQLFETADGWLVLNVGNDTQWRAFCLAAGEPELANHPDYLKNRQRVERRAELVPRIEALMKTYTTRVWEEKLTQANVPHAVVRNYRQIFEDPNTLARGMKVTVKDPEGREVDLLGNPIHFHGEPWQSPTMPPLLGADTEAVLKEWANLSGSSIQDLKTRNIV